MYGEIESSHHIKDMLAEGKLAEIVTGAGMQPNNREIPVWYRDIVDYGVDLDAVNGYRYGYERNLGSNKQFFSVSDACS